MGAYLSLVDLGHLGGSFLILIALIKGIHLKLTIPAAISQNGLPPCVYSKIEVVEIRGSMNLGSN